ncbi:T9SS type A sorting domain-containing protein [Flavobacterium aciduliphilum]|uniref:Putative secreted protein (Por secretion system target) n=1 Tax=Flavobacterium aciduliphilum TaxID=1101402 RepID=A0A328YCR6_9FLAO|nr:T9SS type A sorting domain-containing protein [Flavobacterium aciduliphilum]RAR71729.1 putative secreted protein (Por secretion system target) [Flavobacterium aciduliphilum]
MKQFVFIAAFFCTALNFAQISMYKHDMTPILNGQVVAFNTTTFPDNELDFYIKNNSASSVSVKVSCVSLLNNDGTGFELCFGPECLSFVEEGTSYPTNPVVIAANGTNGNFDHFLNTNASAGVFPRDYNFRFYQVGNPSGNTIDFTYRYDPGLSVHDIEQLQTYGVIIKSTQVVDALELDVLKSTNLELYDLNGKIVKDKIKLYYGVQTLDVSNLSSGTYIINFISDDGNSSKVKFNKK